MTRQERSREKSGEVTEGPRQNAEAGGRGLPGNCETEGVYPDRN